MVVNEVVVWMGNPEAAWCLICVQKTPGSLGLHNQVLGDVVLGLNSVFNENGVALNFVSNVAFESQVMSSMDCESSVEALMDSDLFDVGFVDCTDHMEMDSISSQFEGLANIGEFDVVESGNQRVITR